MLAIIKDALAIRKAHITRGIPMNVNMGFKEANIAFALWAAFYRADYLGFPEFPHKNGSIDAIFVRGGEIVVCEWKQVYYASMSKIVEQTVRMLRFDPVRELRRHGFKRKKWKIRRLWVCDTWQPRAVDWWMGHETRIRTLRPFDSKWTVGKEDFATLGNGWNPYFWVWAFRQG